MANRISSINKTNTGRTSIFRRYRRDEDGNITIEYMLWVPFIIAILMLIFDVSMTLHTSSRMWDLARDSARAVAVTPDADKAALITSQIMHIKASLSNSAGYTVTITPTDGVADTVTVIITAVGYHGDIPSMMDFASLSDLGVKYIMRDEM